MSSEVLLLEKSEAIATVTLNRPDAMNALSSALRDAITHAFREIQADPAGFYVNVQTADFPGGEIRGQLAATVNAPLRCELGTIPAGAEEQGETAPAGETAENVEDAEAAQAEAEPVGDGEGPT